MDELVQPITVLSTCFAEHLVRKRDHCKKENEIKAIKNA
jgi:hypothetical protein